MSKISKFSDLNLPKAVLKNLDMLGYRSMTPIQEISIPSILKGQDVVDQAKTG